MKKLFCITVALLTLGSPAYAQLGGLLKRAQQAVDQKQKVDDLTVTDEEERQIGAAVSLKIRQRFGVVQDGAVHRYVTLVGTVLAEQTSRPKLSWTFIVLDTDGVNAFAAPGGFVHITRGALGLIENEAQLAGVLAHEVTHVAHRHTVNAIRKNKAVQLGTGEMANRATLLTRLADRAYEMVLENAFDRGDELDADRNAVAIAAKAGYAPPALAEFLTRLAERNKDQTQRNGLFASHPETEERITTVRQLAGSRSGAAVVERYKAAIAYEPTEITKIAVIVEGSAGVAGDEKDKDEPKEEPRKRRFGLGALRETVAPERQSAQVTASGGSRGVGPDRLAKGGDNANPVTVSVSADEVAEFEKGIV